MLTKARMHQGSVEALFRLRAPGSTLKYGAPARNSPQSKQWSHTAQNNIHGSLVTSMELGYQDVVRQANKTRQRTLLTLPCPSRNREGEGAHIGLPEQMKLREMGKEQKRRT